MAFNHLHTSAQRLLLLLVIFSLRRIEVATRKELIQMLDDQNVGEDDVIVCADMGGGWDNIVEVASLNGTPAIVFGGGSPFSDE